MRARSCPSEDELVHFSTRELSPRIAAKIRAHVSECSVCAAQLKAWEETLDAYRRHMPAAGEELPQWHGFSAALRQEESTWHRHRADRSRRQWIVAAAMAASLLVAVWFWPRTEVVLNAEEVISRALRQEESNPSFTATAVWIRQTAASAASPVGDSPQRNRIQRTSDTIAEVVATRGELTRELANRLAPYGFNLTSPLSAQPVQRWRATTDHATEHIVAFDPGLLKVSTTTAVGTVRLAEIIVRQHTYEPVSQHWQFADGFEVELTSVKPDVATPVAPKAVEAEVETARSAARPIDLDGLELELRQALYRLGAHVGTKVAIRQVPSGTIRVEGTVDSTETVRQIAVYARRRGLVKTLVEVDPKAAHRDVADSPAVRAWLAQAFPDSDLREAFVARTWELLDDVASRAAALEELGGRYNEDRAAALSTEVHRLLTDLAAQQYAGLATSYEALERHLAPLIGTISRPVLPSELPVEWRRVGAHAGDAIGELTTGLQAVFDVNSDTTADDLVLHARNVLRSALESLASRIAPS